MHNLLVHSLDLSDWRSRSLNDISCAVDLLAPVMVRQATLWRLSERDIYAFTDNHSDTWSFGNNLQDLSTKELARTFNRKSTDR